MGMIKDFIEFMFLFQQYAIPTNNISVKLCSNCQNDMLHEDTLKLNTLGIPPMFMGFTIHTVDNSNKDCFSCYKVKI